MLKVGFLALFALSSRNRGDAVFNAVIMVFASIFLFKGLGALIY